MDVRRLSVDDLDLICRHREEMFRDSGHDEQVLNTVTKHFRAWLAQRLDDGSYFGYILSDNGTPVAGIGLMLID
jgi:hypothetical protein